MNMRIKNDLICSMIFITVFSRLHLYGQDDLIFVPDGGIRVDSAGISKALIDTAGSYLIYYSHGPDQGLAVSEDGLDFTVVNIQDHPDHRHHVLPDSTHRRYFVEIEDDTARLKSQSSDSGSGFSMDPGNRYVFPSNDAITDPHVYATYFNNALGEVYMVYLAGEIDNARSIHAEPGNNGWDLGSYTTDIFGDSVLGGGNQSYWDPHAIVLPDDRVRIFTMNQHGHPVPPAEPKGTIYSFTSEDHGMTFTQDPDRRLRFDDYTEFEVLSLNDPKVILLPDGRYRMYVASMIRTGPGDDDIKWAILSATTVVTNTVRAEQNAFPTGIRLIKNFPNPFNSSTRITYELLEDNYVTLRIYDISGREVATLVDQGQEQGDLSIMWDGKDNIGQPVSPGIYLYRIQARRYGHTRKMILLE